MKKITTLAAALFAVSMNAQWSAFAPGSTNNTVVDYEMYNGDLYAAGLFSTINGVSQPSVAKWNGTTWTAPASNAMTDGAHNLSVIDSNLYCVRYEFQVDSNWVYYLNGGAWAKLGTGFYLNGANTGQFYTCSMYDVQKYNNEIYACGEFNRNGSKVINCIARWNGAEWDSLTSGLSQPFNGNQVYPHQMLVHNGNLYVCGNFKTAGGVTVNGVAVWNGISWSALGNGFNSTVYALGVYNNELYAGGDFTMSGTTNLGAIAKWNGTGWVSPGFDFSYVNPSGYLFVHTIKEFNNKLFIAGGFDRVTPTAQAAMKAGSVVSFNGLVIDTLDGGANNDVEGMILYQNKLLIGGFFSSVGAGVAAGKTAVYDFTGVGIAEGKEQLFSANVFPNPTPNTIRVQSSSVFTFFRILNLEGQELLRVYNSAEADISTLQKGVYLLEIFESNGVRKVSRLVKY